MKSYEAKSVIFGSLGAFWGFSDLFCAPGDVESLPKWTNGEASGLKMCKFEFSTINNH